MISDDCRHLDVDRKPNLVLVKKNYSSKFLYRPFLFLSHPSSRNKKYGRQHDTCLLSSRINEIAIEYVAMGGHVIEHSTWSSIVRWSFSWVDVRLFMPQKNANKNLQTPFEIILFEAGGLV
ncbi:hypothetical protein OUZ56_011080 [Daphnia magna]|uniref:Uncharacterized protein n=1 Tax=Daphnia magna TaxID=35525 RepID=A0ABQ9YZ73_9CRUS|nr:hypothetical protein OUZ56_011080 [Daphnia magna]